MACTGRSSLKSRASSVRQIAVKLGAMDVYGHDLTLAFPGRKIEATDRFHRVMLHENESCRQVWQMLGCQGIKVR